jgi:hypothetical protein
VKNRTEGKGTRNDEGTGKCAMSNVCFSMCKKERNMGFEKVYE